MSLNSENIAKKVEFRNEKELKEGQDVFESNVKHRLQIESKKREINRDRQDYANDLKLKNETKLTNA